MKKLLVFALALAGLFSACSDENIQGANAQNSKHIELYQSPACGCCGKWVEYMCAKGYTVSVHKDDAYYDYKGERFGIKDIYESCHTGLAGGYALEGHLPEDAVAWLLTAKPEGVIGIAVPGMPMGSPGMELGGEDEQYPVVIMLKDGGYKIYGIYKGHQLIENGEF